MSLNRWGVSLIAVILLAGVARGQESAIDVLQPRVSRQQFAQYVESLNLDRDQQLIVDMRYGDYLDSIVSLERELDEAADRAGRGAVQDALSGRAFVDPTDLRRMRADVLATYATGVPVMESMVDDLLADIGVQLTRGQTAAHERASARLMRRVTLKPWQRAAMTYDYAGDGVDLVELIELAAAPGGELEGRPIAELRPVVAQYEQDLARLLATVGPVIRTARLERRIAAIQRDAAAERLAQRELIDAWQRLYELNGTTAGRIADVLEQAAGSGISHAWIDRVDAATFPWLYETTEPDFQIDWLERQEFDADTLDRARAIHATYAGQLRALRRAAVDIMVAARIKQGVIVQAMMDPTKIDGTGLRGAYEALVQNSGQIGQLERDAVQAIEKLLSDDDRERIRRGVRLRARRGR